MMEGRVRVFFFFNETAASEIYTLSLHDALPILATTEMPPEATGVAAGVGGDAGTAVGEVVSAAPALGVTASPETTIVPRDRKSTRLNSSHANISYAVFCLKKKQFFSLSSYARRI